MANTTLTLLGVTEASLVLDPNIFGTSNGQLIIIQTPFSTLSPDVSLSASSQLLVVESDMPQVATLGQIAKTVGAIPPAIGNSIKPSLSLDASVMRSLTSDAAGTLPQRTPGGVVQGWVDSTANEYLFNQTTAANAPSLVVNSQNGYSGVQFPTDTGSNWAGLDCNASSLVTTAHTAVQAGGVGLTVALAFKCSAKPAVADLLAYIGNATGSYIAIGQDAHGNINATYINGTGTGTSFIQAPAGGTLTKVIGTWAPGASNGSVTVVVNGASGSASNYSFDPTSFTVATVGNVNQTSGFQLSDFYEFDVWLSTASQTDLGSIESYLTQKWGS